MMLVTALKEEIIFLKEKVALLEDQVIKLTEENEQLKEERAMVKLRIADLEKANDNYSDVAETLRVRNFNK